MILDFEKIFFALFCILKHILALEGIGDDVDGKKK